MTTSCNDSDERPREGVETYEWEWDIVAETHAEERPFGEVEYFFFISDTAFRDAWIESNQSLNLAKMA